MRAAAKDVGKAAIQAAAVQRGLEQDLAAERKAMLEALTGAAAAISGGGLQSCQSLRDLAAGVCGPHPPHTHVLCYAVLCAALRCRAIAAAGACCLLSLSMDSECPCRRTAAAAFTLLMIWLLLLPLLLLLLQSWQVLPSDKHSCVRQQSRHLLHAQQTQVQSRCLTVPRSISSSINSNSNNNNVCLASVDCVSCWGEGEAKTIARLTLAAAPAATATAAAAAAAVTFAFFGTDWSVKCVQ